MSGSISSSGLRCISFSCIQWLLKHSVSLLSIVFKLRVGDCGQLGTFGEISLSTSKLSKRSLSGGCVDNTSKETIDLGDTDNNSNFCGAIAKIYRETYC